MSVLFSSRLREQGFFKQCNHLTETSVHFSVFSFVLFSEVKSLRPGRCDNFSVGQSKGKVVLKQHNENGGRYGTEYLKVVFGMLEYSNYI